MVFIANVVVSDVAMNFVVVVVVAVLQFCWLRSLAILVALQQMNLIGIETINDDFQFSLHADDSIDKSPEHFHIRHGSRGIGI